MRGLSLLWRSPVPVSHRLHAARFFAADGRRGGGGGGGGKRRDDFRPRQQSPEQQMYEEEDVKDQLDAWSAAGEAPEAAREIERLAEQVLQTDDYDASDPQAMAERLDLDDDMRKQYTSWETLARRKSEQKVFDELGVENPADVQKRIEEGLELGVAPEPEDVELVREYEGASENPIETALGEDASSMQHLLEVSRGYQEMARLLPTEGRDPPGGLAPLKLNRRVDEEKLFARHRPAGARDFVMAEELDEQAALPLERDLAQEASQKHRCPTCWCRNRAPPLDPMNVHLLLKFMNLEGRILPRRQTRLCAKWQRKVASTIRRAKHLGLFSYKHGRFTVTDPFQETPSHEDVLDDLAVKAFERLYPKDAPPSFKKELGKSAD